MEFETQQGQNAREAPPGVVLVALLQGFPDGREVADQVAAGHEAARSAFELFNQELAVQPTEDGEPESPAALMTADTLGAVGGASTLA